MSYGVNVPIISNNELTKEIYEFKVHGTRLAYEGYMKYNRDKETDVWPDEWPNAIGLEKWVELNDPDWDKHRHYEGEVPEAYEKYYDSLNPCMNKTSDGRVMGGGMSGYNLKKYHPLPSNVPALAREILFQNLTVDGE